MNPIPATITIAPRGKAFRLVRLNEVVGDKVLPVLIPGRYLTRSAADTAVKRIDPRLKAAVVLIDELATGVES